MLSADANRPNDRPAVVAEGLTKRFGERLAVDRIDLELPAGVVSGFVGPNGAGKTTTIQMLLGLIAATLRPEPELAILDEPTNGLDPAGIREIRALLRQLADRGIAVFVSSHLLAEIEAICDHLVMIDHGHIVFQGSVEGLLAAQRTELLA